MTHEREKTKKDFSLSLSFILFNAYKFSTRDCINTIKRISMGEIVARLYSDPSNQLERLESAQLDDSSIVRTRAITPFLSLAQVEMFDCFV